MKIRVTPHPRIFQPGQEIGDDFNVELPDADPQLHLDEVPGIFCAELSRMNKNIGDHISTLGKMKKQCQTETTWLTDYFALNDDVFQHDPPGIDR